MKRHLFSLLFLTTPLLQARPIITEEAATLGRSTFEATFKGSVREDSFNTPESTYKSAVLPVRARLGLLSKLDLGFTLTHLSQSLETGNTRLTGSRPALFSPELKYSVNNSIGVLAIWHTALQEKPQQELPIARGDDYEIVSLFRIPVRFPSHLNIGYLFRGNYRSRFGIEGGPISKVTPGDIFQAKTSLEIPLRNAFSLLSELAYYNVQTRKIDGVDLNGSAGDALDALVGISWENKGWNIALATSFGLLNESHTSFDLERGAGDVSYHLSFSYRLKARKPNQ